MPPLTEAERREILARRNAAPASPGALPSGLPEGVYPSSYTKRGLRMNFPPPPSVANRALEEERAKRNLEVENPIPTADQRDRLTIASEALRKVQGIRKTLRISGKTLLNRNPLTVWKQTPNTVQNPFLAPDAKQLRTQFNSAADLLAMLRTGKQGEKTQVDRVIAEYNPGNFDDSKTIMNRLEEMENEIRAFGSGQLKSPLDDKAMPTGDGASPLGHLTDEQLKAILGQ